MMFVFEQQKSFFLRLQIGFGPSSFFFLVPLFFWCNCNCNIKFFFSIMKSLALEIQRAHKLVPIGASFFHYRGGLYRVMDHVIDEKTQKPMVVYVPEPGTSAICIKFVRPLAEWYEKCKVTIPRDPWNGPGESIAFVERFKLHRKYD